MNKQEEAPVELSERLKAVAGLVTEGASVADIGTDHGYIPIWLAETGRCTRIIASDVNRGPADRAAEHIRACGLADRIEVRCADGLKGLCPGEAETVILAGMGGPLMIRILEESPEIVEKVREFILQPQSEIGKVRAYLNRRGFRVIAEELVEEAGKYYPMMKAVHGEESAYLPEELLYGRILLAKRHRTLYRYLLRERRIQGELLDRLTEQSGERVEKRRAQVEETLVELDGILGRWGGGPQDPEKA